MSKQTADGREIITATVSLAWWCPLYVDVLVFFCNLMGTEPDWDKLERILNKAVKVKEVER